MKTAKKPGKSTLESWKARALKAERVAAAAIEFEYRYFMNYQTYTSRAAAESADNQKDKAFEELRWVLRDTGLIKRD